LPGLRRDAMGMLVARDPLGKRRIRRSAAFASGGRHGLFFDGHRAEEDCRAGIEVLCRTLPHSGRTGLAVLLESARTHEGEFGQLVLPMHCGIF